MDLKEAFAEASIGGGGKQEKPPTVANEPKPQPAPNPVDKPAPTVPPVPEAPRPNPPGPVRGRPHWRWPPYGPASLIGYDYILPNRYYYNPPWDRTVLVQDDTTKQPQVEQPNYNLYFLAIVLALIIIIGLITVRR